MNRIPIFVLPSFYEEEYRYLLIVQIYWIFDNFKIFCIDPIIFFLEFFYKPQFHLYTYKSIKSFFEDGYSFPQLVSLILKDNKKIDPIKYDIPISNENNQKALEYLIENRPIKMDKSFETNDQKINMLKTIITKIIIYTNPEEIFEQSKKIIESNKKNPNDEISIQNINELLTKRNFLILLNILIYKSWPNENMLKTESFDQIIKFIINELGKQKKDIPLFISSLFFDEKYHFLILIQIKILFHFFKLIEINPIIEFLYDIFEGQFRKDDLSSIKSFFSSGIYFPKLVKIVLKEDKEIESNEEALELLNEKYRNNSEIIEQDQKIDTEEEQTKILKIIITKIIFNINPEEIFSKCQTIFEQNHQTLNNYDELFEKQTILKLINFLFYKGQLKNTSSNDLENVIRQFGNEYQTKLFISSKLYQNQYQFLILTQIDFLLNKYKIIFKNPILKFFNFCFSGKSFNCSNLTIDLFFNNKTHFPRLISLILEKGFSLYVAGYSNSLEYLVGRFPSIKNQINTQLQTTNDRINVLKVIITRVMYNINQDDIFEQSKAFLKTYDIEIQNMNELFDKRNILILIHLLLNNKKPNEEEIKADNFNETIKNICKN